MGEGWGEGEIIILPLSPTPRRLFPTPSTSSFHGVVSHRGRGAFTSLSRMLNHILLGKFGFEIGIKDRRGDHAWDTKDGLETQHRD